MVRRIKGKEKSRTGNWRAARLESVGSESLQTSYLLLWWVPASKASRNISENTNPVKLLWDCYFQPFLVNFTAHLTFILSNFILQYNQQNQVGNEMYFLYLHNNLLLLLHLLKKGSLRDSRWINISFIIKGCEYKSTENRKRVLCVSSCWGVLCASTFIAIALIN